MQFDRSEIEDIYELSPLQQGMLFHTLRDKGVGMYVTQAVFTLDRVDAEAMRRAWQRVIERHTILRTSFHWENADNPLQVVHRKVTVPFEIEDWRETPPAEQEARLRNFLQENRQREYDLTKAPLLRLFLCRIAQDTYHLIFSHHHLLLDGWSNPLLLGEVRAFYEAERAQRAIDLPRPQPFREYIAWLKAQDVEKAESFWRKYLRGIKAPTPLPAQKAMTVQARQRLNFDEWTLRLPESMVVELKALARKCHVTLNTLIQGAWAIMLGRYSGQQDVVFGMLVSGRPAELPGVESIIGMFLNSVPVRIKVDYQQPLIEWLKVLQDEQSELKQYEFSSLMKVQDWSEIPKGTPLFECIIDNNNTPESSLSSKSAIGHKSKASSLSQNFPLHLDIEAYNDELVIKLTFDTRRFEKHAMTRLMEQYRTLMESMVEDPTRRLAELPLMSENERHQVLVVSNQTERRYPKDLCLHQLFEAQAARTPQAAAVSYQNQELTYEELNQRSNRLAQHLRSLDVKPGSIVGISIERSLEMVTAILAVLKSGAAYVPLDPSYPLDRLRFMVQDAGVNVLLTREAMLGTLPCESIQVICFGRDDAKWQDQSPDNPPNRTSPEDLAYVLYTSGSTGNPKGVAIPHRVSVNRMHTEFDAFRPDEALCVKTSLGFVDSIWELFSGWQHGLKVTLVPETHLQDPNLLVETLASARATRIVLVPSLLRMLLESEIDLAEKLPLLEHWISSGEPLTATLCSSFAERLPSAVLTNLYGTSEIWDATRCDSRQRPPGKPLPIGKPLGNVRVYVLDEGMQPVPVGIPGELYVGGDGLARGYWGRADLTAEKFVPNPFGVTPGERFYQTGDRVRWLPDGNLEHLGRLDQQFKMRGFRIEPEEIENVLREHPQISKAIVAVKGEEQLVAYVIVKDQSLDVADAREFARSRLPEHMTPTFFVVVDEFPLTPSGKIDRRALPAPTGDNLEQADSADQFREPETELEKTIAGVWEEFLNVGKISTDQNFFDLGGHSLMATRVALRLKEALKMDVPLRSLFETPTIRGLAEWAEKIRAGDGGHEEEDIPELVRAERGKEVPLSFAQQRLWFFDQLNPGNASYTVSNIMQFSGPLNVHALRAALTEVVARHESLRTIFIARDGEPFQVILPPDEPQLSFVDLSGFLEGERDREARRQARELSRLPWDLVSGPLFRAAMIRLSPTNHILALTMHHIITDGRSWGVFARELTTLYGAFQQGRPSPLPELPLQYVDFAIWQRDWMKGELLEKQLNYWKSKLGTTTFLELPTDFPRPTIQRYRGGRCTFRIPGDVVTRFRELSQQENATMFMSLLACFQLLLCRYSGQDDVSVGTPAANRNRVELENLIGLFVNVIVLKTNFASDPTLRELFRDVRKTCLDAYDNQDLPFDKLVDEVQPKRDLSRHPLFQVMFVHQQQKGSVQSESVSWKQRPVELESSNYDLLLATVESESAADMECTLQFNSDLFEKATVERMAERFQLLVDRIVANPDARLSQIPMLSDEERSQLLVDWNSTKAEAPLDRCVHELIQDQVARDPQAIVAIFENVEMSYGELDRRANQLARRLQNFGVRPESVVGLCADRSLDMLVGVLGILKAGGAFLPMNPAYPSDRLNYMLQDTQAAVVLTQEKYKELVPKSPKHVVCLDADWAEIESESTDPPSCEVQPENLAYIIYTSGSTGAPKGVLVEHKNLANVIRAQIREFQITPQSRVLQMMSLSFDAAVGEIFRALCAGATLVLASNEDLLPGPGLVQILKEKKITATALSPTALAALPGVNGDLPELRTLTVGGEACPAELAARWGRGRRLINGYGPTETTIGATLAANWDLNRKPPLGRPLENVQVYVLDRWMHPTPIGTPGELFIGGVGVTRGYLNRPDITGERFVPNPYGQSPGERLYRTGDLVRWLPDGNLDFLGRIDQQVKIRGYRIELGEIESVLQEHETVGQCVVDVNDERGVRRLVAYVTPRGAAKPEISELRNLLKNRLPDYMVPSFFMVLPSLPMTTSGKVDRKSLPAPDLGQLTSQTEFVAPRSETEAALASIWTQVLGLEQVGIHDNFFELGGDSILSIQVVARATEAGLKITPKDLFQHQTVEELSQVVGTAEVVTAQQGVITGDVPLTPIQHWFFEQELPQANHFNQSQTLPAMPTLDAKLLKQAMRHLIEHHDVFRLRFTHSENCWSQHIAPPTDDVPFAYFDLSALSDEEMRSQYKVHTHEMQTSLDLANGPLLRVVWFNLGNHGTRLIMIAHHMAIDAVSWRIVIEDLRTAYRQLRAQQPVRLPAKTTSYMRWAEALIEYSQSDELRGEIDYWLDARRREVSPLPVDFPQGENTKQSSQKMEIALTAEDTRRLLREVPRVYKTQINDVLLTALGESLRRWCGGQRWLIDLEGHGREDIGIPVDISRTVGWFTNFYPVFLDLSQGDRIDKLLGSVKEQLLAVPNRGIGYGVLRYLCPDQAVRENVKSMPESQVSLNYFGQQEAGAQRRSDDDAGLVRKIKGHVGATQSEHGNRLHLIEVEGAVRGGSLQIQWNYSSNLHEDATVERLAGDFYVVLREIIDSCQTADLTSLTPVDFPMANLSQNDLDALITQLSGKKTEDQPS